MIDIMDVITIVDGVLVLKAGAAAVFDTSDIDYTSVTSMDSTHAIVTYRDYGNVRYGTACCLTLTGTTITAGTPVVFESAYAADISVTSMDSTHAIVTYRDNGNSDYGTACCLTLATATITAGTPVVFESASTLYISVTSMYSTHAIVTYRDNGSGIQDGTSCCLYLE